MAISNLTNEMVYNDFPEWEYLATETAKVFNLTKKEAENLYNCNTAKIIAAIPFAANCKEPERTAIAHLCIYVAEVRGFQKYYAHLPSDDDDIFNRLSFISNFESGNQAVIEHGMNILAYIMIEGYNNSRDKDLQEGKYNPFNSGKWNYKELNNLLMKKINEMECSLIDTFFISNKLLWDFS